MYLLTIYKNTIMNSIATNLITVLNTSARATDIMNIQMATINGEREPYFFASKKTNREIKPCVIKNIGVPIPIAGIFIHLCLGHIYLVGLFSRNKFITFIV